MKLVNFDMSHIARLGHGVQLVQVSAVVSQIRVVSNASYVALKVDFIESDQGHKLSDICFSEDISH